MATLFCPGLCHPAKAAILLLPVTQILKICSRSNTAVHNARATEIGEEGPKLTTPWGIKILSPAWQVKRIFLAGIMRTRVVRFCSECNC